jgi:hypothetical protein
LIATTEGISQHAKHYIQAYKGEFSYIDVGEILVGRGVTEEEQAGQLLALSVICHNIPYYENGQRCTRELSECLKDTITFYNANKAELDIVRNSKEKTWTDLLSGYTLPKLSLGDISHYTFKSGSGNSKPDLQDENGVTYEVKRNYRGGSRASLHKADYLIDCKNTTIEIRKIGENQTVDLEHYPIARFNGFLSEKLIQPTNNINPKMMLRLWSGELIPLVEQDLEAEGFRWNP